MSLADTDVTREAHVNLLMLPLLMHVCMQVQCILLTQIAAHTLTSRPLVFPEHVKLRIQVLPHRLVRPVALCATQGTHVSTSENRPQSCQQVNLVRTGAAF